jgi:hypothetical protein
LDNLTLRQAVVICLIIIVASLPALWAGQVNAGMSALLPNIDTADAYFSLIRPGLQYIAMPVVLLSSMMLVMAPGLLLVAAAGRMTNIYLWTSQAFVISLIGISVMTAIIQSLTGQPLVGRSFVLAVICLALPGALAFVVRTMQGKIVRRVNTGCLARETAVLLGVPVLFAVALTPKFFWEAFTGDGAHTYEAARLLLYQVWPFWSDMAGTISGWPGINGITLLYPVSWFMRIFGLSESGVRLPLILFLPVLYAGIRVVIETNRIQHLKPVETVLIWTSILSFALVMSYSAAYNPYSADIGMPATHDMLVMIFFLGAIGAWIRKKYGELTAWIMLTLATSPASLVMIAAALVGILVAKRPWRWKLSFQYGLAFLACLVALFVLPYLLALFGVPEPGTEHGTGLLRYFAFIALGDFERFLYAFLPVGLYPVIGVLAWRGADEAGRVMIAVTVLVFAMYYVIGASSLHHFVPAMVLSVVVFWRRFHANQLGTSRLIACAITAIIAVWYALPSGSGIYTATRDIGTRLDASGFPGYHDMDQRAIGASDGLTALFPTDANAEVPEKRYGDSPLAWNYYAQHAYADASTKSYVLAPADKEAPKGATEVGRNEIAAVYVMDDAQWELDKKLQPTHSRGKQVYQIDRDVLFVRGAARERFGFFSPGIWLFDLLDIDY